MANSVLYDVNRTDVKNIVMLEHINIEIPSQPIASVFFCQGLRLTRDPYRRFSDHTMWINVGYQQFHLVTSATPQHVTGEVGLIVPDLKALEESLGTVGDKLAETQFTWSKGKGDTYFGKDQAFLEVTGPWGTHFKIYDKSVIAFRGNLGIAYLEVYCSQGTASHISTYFKKHLGADCIDNPGLVAVSVGPNQKLIFKESDKCEAYTKLNDWHACVYVAQFETLL